MRAELGALAHKLSPEDQELAAFFTQELTSVEKQKYLLEGMLSLAYLEFLPPLLPFIGMPGFTILHPDIKACREDLPFGGSGVFNGSTDITLTSIDDGQRE